MVVARQEARVRVCVTGGATERLDLLLLRGVALGAIEGVVVVLVVGAAEAAATGFTLADDGAWLATSPYVAPKAARASAPNCIVMRVRRFIVFLPSLRPAAEGLYRWCCGRLGQDTAQIFSSC
jgi:hypothetical protein